jgi:hypothetical protein
MITDLRTIDSHCTHVKLDTPLLQAETPRMIPGKCPQDGVPTQYLVPQPNRFGPIRSLKTASINYAILNSWLELCRAMHTQECTSQPPERKCVQHLEFINCHSRQFAPAKNTEYITLRYVWGRGEPCIEYLEQLTAKHDRGRHYIYGSTASASTNRKKSMHISR